MYTSTVRDDLRLMLVEAVRMATHFHDGQKDKAGLPYIEHVLRVTGSLETSEERVVGLLHDLLEDTVVDEEMLRRRFSWDMVEKVIVLTRQKDESYFAYIVRVSKDPLARKVKIADLKDHLRPETLSVLTELHKTRYERALELLTR